MWDKSLPFQYSGDGERAGSEAHGKVVLAPGRPAVPGYGTYPPGVSDRRIGRGQRCETLPRVAPNGAAGHLGEAAARIRALRGRAPLTAGRPGFTSRFPAAPADPPGPRGPRHREVPWQQWFPPLPWYQYHTGTGWLMVRLTRLAARPGARSRPTRHNIRTFPQRGDRRFTIPFAHPRRKWCCRRVRPGGCSPRAWTGKPPAGRPPCAAIPRWRRRSSRPWP